MSDLVKVVRAKVSKSCCAKLCKKEGCKVSLPSKCRHRVLIDMDPRESPAGKHGKRCDFLFVGEAKGEGWVVPIELKKGKVNSSEVVPQLQAGAKVAEKVVPKDAELRFRPVVAYGRIRKHERNLFQEEKNKIWFREMREPILLIKCGSSLNQAIG